MKYIEHNSAIYNLLSDNVFECTVLCICVDLIHVMHFTMGRGGPSMHSGVALGASFLCQGILGQLCHLAWCIV